MSAFRVRPIDPPFSPATAVALDRIMPPGVPPLVLFRTLAVNERVFLRVMAGGLLDRGSISLRDRELVIDRTCARLGAEYEWGVHVAMFSEKAGLTRPELTATLETRVSTSELSGHDALLLALVDELVDTATVGDPLWAKLAAEWSPEQLVELVAVVGFYHLIAFSVNAFRVPLESFGATFAEYSASR